LFKGKAAHAETHVGAEEADKKDIAQTLTSGFILCIGRLVAGRVSLARDTNWSEANCSSLPTKTIKKTNMCKYIEFNNALL